MHSDVAAPDNSLEVANSIVAALGFGLATISLTWQMTMWRLAGSRAKAQALKAAIQTTGTAYATLPVAKSWEEVNRLATQGFKRKALFLRVINTGRQPVQVERWSVLFPDGIRVGQINSGLGPDQPHRIEVGSSEKWGIEVDAIMSTVQFVCDKMGKKAIMVRLEVELGHDKVIRTKRVQIPRNLT